MAGKGKATKTEIFCLALTALFVVGVLTAFLWNGCHAGGVEITTRKDTDLTDSLPEKVNINTADETELQRLPGIGPVLAQRIVAWRTENGTFEVPEDLLAVEGIGLATLEGLRDMIVIQEAP